MKPTESGKSTFYQGILRYAWEEIKTMNMQKFKSLWKILVGYLSMKMQSFRHKKQIPRRTTVRREQGRITH